MVLIARAPRLNALKLQCLRARDLSVLMRIVSCCSALDQGAIDHAAYARICLQGICVVMGVGLPLSCSDTSRLSKDWANVFML